MPGKEWHGGQLGLMPDGKAREGRILCGAECPTKEFGCHSK